MKYQEIFYQDLTDEEIKGLAYYQHGVYSGNFKPFETLSPELQLFGKNLFTLWVYTVQAEALPKQEGKN